MAPIAAARPRAEARVGRLDSPNTVIANSTGVLDGSGKARAALQMPPGLTALIGFRLYHAYIVFKSGVDYASTSVPLTLVL